MSDAYRPDIDEGELSPPTARVTVDKGRWTPVDDAAPVINPDDGEAGEAEAAREAFAARLRGSVKSDKRQDPDEKPLLQTFGENFLKSAGEMAPKFIQSIDESFAGHYVPEGAKYLNEAGEYQDENLNVLPVTRKPKILPITKEPTTGEWQGAMPSALDVVTTPGGTSGRTATLTAGFRRPGIGHNQGPPMPPGGGAAPPPPGGGGGVPPPPAAAGAPMAPPPPPRQIISGLTDDVPRTVKEKADDIYTAFLDDLHPLKVLESKAIRNGGPLSPDEQSYQLGRLTRGADGRTEQAIKHGTFDFNTLRNNGDSLEKVLRPVVGDKATREAFENYAVAMRDIELQTRGVETGRSIADAQQVVAAATPEMRSALHGLHGYQDRILQYAVDSGIIGQEAADNMRAANRNYVPFQRVMDPVKDSSTSSSRNIKAWNPIHGIEGSSRDIMSPLETIVRNTHTLIDLAEKSRAMQALVKLSERPGMQGTLTPVRKGSSPIDVSLQELERYFIANGIPVPPQLYGAANNFTVFRPKAFRPKPDEIVVYKDGKPTSYKVDPDIADAVNGFGPAQMNLAVKILSAPARWLRAGVVYGADFISRNPARDQITAAVQSTNNFIPIIGALEGLGHMMGKRKTWSQYQDFLKSGASNSNFVSMDRKYVNEMVNNIGERNLLAKVSRVAKDPLLPARIVSDYLEQATRVGEFVAARRKGKGLHESGFDTREVTTDYGRHGADKFVHGLARSDPFLSPQMQGVDRFARGAKDNPGRVARNLGLYVVVPTIASYIYNRQDPRIAGMTPWDSQNYTPIPTDNWVGVTPEEAEKYSASARKNVGGFDYVNTGTVWKVPKAFEPGALGTFIENTLDSWFQKNPESFKTLVSNLTGRRPEEINNEYFKIKRDPWEKFGEYLTQVFIPSVGMLGTDLPKEINSNWSGFKGRNIVGPTIHNPENRKTEYTHYTTETAKYLGKAGSKIDPEAWFASPETIEYGVRGLTGQIGKGVLDLSDKVIKGLDNKVTGRVPGLRELITGKEEKISPESTLADVPGLGVFVARLPTTGSRDIVDFYRNYDKAKKSAATLKRLGREDQAAADDLRPDSTIMRMEGAAQALAKQRRQIGQIMNEHHRKPETWVGDLPMSAKEKRIALDQVIHTMDTIARNANENYFEKREERRGTR